MGQLPRRWLSADYVQRFLELEKTHQDRALRQVSGPRVLLVGDIISSQQIPSMDFPQVVNVGEAHSSRSRRKLANHTSGNYIVADPAFLPFEPDSFATVLLPHVLEGSPLPHQVLREAHRVLRPDGHLVLNGFNPFSLLGLQRFMSLKAVYSGQYYSVGRVKDWLQLLGFEVVSSAMYQYAPLVSNERLAKSFNFLNSVGDRWLPMSGGGYIISAKKRDIPPTLVGRMRPQKKQRRRQKLVTASSTRKTKLQNSS